MGSLEQVNGESNPVAAFDVKKETPTSNTHEGFDIENQKQKLLWVILIGMIFALIIQSLAANLGVSTEVALIAADVPEACFFGEMGYVKPPAVDLLKGLHNLFLHSALVLSRKIPNSVHGIKDACRYFLMETGFALFVALLINIAVISVSATICSDPNLSGQCNNITLNSASFLLQNVLRKSSSTIYAIALLASGQSSSITCTYAGQFIMQMILSFELPFSLIPLLKFSSSTSKMGPYKGSIYIIVISWILGLAIICANIYYLSTSFVGWMIHSTLPKAATIFIAIIVFPMMVVYVGSVIYLMWRKDTVVTYIDTTKIEPADTEDGEDSIVPYREDLADIPLPQ
ncbi:hypothetical protein RHMOL_Rhmol09G0020300 [Rhododendron molle]|uniref:Uncharacterized protein n=1 Tax=Rhododendron molle TaxID=49168 RepID=A0ACC0M8Z1_RHOML|nr:hypothetical protein RHMOL_Rhmol09G0020300 [Rhododendron molle]